MKHKINPIVDCVFKALLGSEKNKNLLVHFLNAVTELTDDNAITDVVIMNPYNDREFLTDKLSIVDIKAKCQKEFKYQVEIQLSVYPSLPSRMMHNWSAVYHSQIGKSENYSKLKPVISIWLLDTPLFKDAGNYHLNFGIHDTTNDISLTDHLNIHLLQLSLFNENKEIHNEKERWLYFFKQAENQDLENLPETMKTKEMIQAMETLQDFSENEKNYLLYQSRINAQLEYNTWKAMIADIEQELTIKKKEISEKNQEISEKNQKISEKDQKISEKDQKIQKIMQEKEEEQMAKERALKEKELYLSILKAKGIDINALSTE
ncbi:conserved hypothetical protein [Desulfamplus magnetovallimortis]|uniref:Rpn family recombination-promoting nuclease/putative transposase n=1 Tax=Desulfamplus magnetovallimortis TaxID=1246637 RepID=A0A1W1HAL6_9BACT|nr:Rpn family recombination-promoting nuclease/putative transposase [Desulfamplus magnetovallimortis]SLM29462.1 conserved hypothetical protein [Desulfamplus magnetovallimortis]